MTSPRYEHYRPSGVEWLGEIPAHWAVDRLNTLFGEVVEPGSDDLPMLSVSIHSGVSDAELAPDEMDRNVTRSDDRSKYKQVRPNDLVYNMMRAWQGGFGTVRTIGMVSPAYVVARPKGSTSTLFIERLLRTPAAVEEMRRHSRGVTDFRLRLYWDEFKNIRIPLPPQDEQAAINAFLDRETAKIDALVEAQRWLMELLNEKMIALALSSFEPGNTQEIRFGSVVDLISRPVAQTDGEYYEPIGLFNRGRGIFHKDPRVKDDMGDSDFFWIEEGDLIISGQFAWEGAVALASKEEHGCVVSHRYPVVRGKPGLALTEYVLAILSSKHGDYLLNENSRGAAGRNRPLNIDLLLKEKIPVADGRIQERVRQAIHAKNQLSKELSVQIELLQERRNALISAAVTGKIDVRGRVPVEAEAA